MWVVRLCSWEHGVGKSYYWTWSYSEYLVSQSLPLLLAWRQDKTVAGDGSVRSMLDVVCWIVVLGCCLSIRTPVVVGLALQSSWHDDSEDLVTLLCEYWRIAFCRQPGLLPTWNDDEKPCSLLLCCCQEMMVCRCLTSLLDGNICWVIWIGFFVVMMMNHFPSPCWRCKIDDVPRLVVDLWEDGHPCGYWLRAWQYCRCYY